MPTVVKLVLYPIFALFCLVLFTVLLFPFDSLKGRVADEMEKGLGGRYTISIGKLSPAPLTGLVLKDLSIEPGGAEISRLKLKFGLIALLRKSLAVDFVAHTKTGRAKGSLAWSQGAASIDVQMDGLDLASVPFATEKLGVGVGGEVSGSIDLDLYSQDPLRNTGKVLLDLNRLELKEGMVGGAVQIPAIRLVGASTEKSRFEATVNRGNWEVTVVKLLGGDLECDLNGKIYGARNVTNYRFNIKGALRLSPELVQKVPILAIIEKQKSPDGSYPLTVTGRFSKPSIRVGDFKVPI